MHEAFTSKVFLKIFISSPWVTWQSFPTRRCPLAAARICLRKSSSPSKVPCCCHTPTSSTVFSTAAPAWGWELPRALLKSPPAPLDPVNLFTPPRTAPLSIAFGVYSRPSPLSLLLPAPQGKLGPSACSPFNYINASASTSTLISQMPECQLVSLNTVKGTFLISEVELEISVPNTDPRIRKKVKK